MPLDPSIAPIVELVTAASAEAPPIWEQSVEERRAAYLALVAMAGEGPELAEVIDGSAGDIPLRIYRPVMVDGVATGHGVSVFYHGGGWVIGDLDSHDEVCRQLAAQSGAVIVSVDYRLAPEARFPAAVDDAWQALQWVADNRKELCGDADAKLTVGGDSAGGNLAAVVALMARDAGLELAGQLLVYPSVNMDNEQFPSLEENAEGYVLTAETMKWFRAQYFAEDGPNSLDNARSDWRAAPLQADSFEGLAPALIITAEFDPLRDEGAAYAAALTKAGVAVTHTLYEGMVHIFFQLGPVIPKAAEAVTEVAESIKTFSR